MARPFFHIVAKSNDEWDYTSAVNWQNYAVNQSEENSEWTDANHKKHKNIARTRVVGTVELGFWKDIHLTAFMNDLANERSSDGTNRLSLYVTNLDRAVYQKAFFVERVGDIRYDFLNGRRWQTITLSIEEP